MSFNLNSGYGRLLASRISTIAQEANASGKLFVVAPSTHPHYSELQQIFVPDPDGALILFNTVTAALAACTAGAGDVIIVTEGYTESVTSSSSTSWGVAGVKIIGMGVGLARPTFTFASAATATINVSAAQMMVQNCIFFANFADVASAFTLAAAKDFTVDSCLFYDSASNLDFLCIVTTGATDNAADGLTFTNNQVFSLPTTDGAVISILGNLARLNCSFNVVDKAATSNNGHLITMSSKVTLNVRIIGNVLTVVGATTATVGILFTGSQTTGSGICSDNYVSSLDTTAALIATAGTKIAFIQNFLTGVVDKSGAVWPVADDHS